MRLPDIARNMTAPTENRSRPRVDLVGRAARLLGRHVPGRAHDDALRRGDERDRAVADAREAEVEQLRVARRW